MRRRSEISRDTRAAGSQAPLSVRTLRCSASRSTPPEAIIAVAAADPVVALATPPVAPLRGYRLPGEGAILRRKSSRVTCIPAAASLGLRSRKRQHLQDFRWFHFPARCADAPRLTSTKLKCATIRPSTCVPESVNLRCCATAVGRISAIWEFLGGWDVSTDSGNDMRIARSRLGRADGQTSGRRRRLANPSPHVPIPSRLDAAGTLRTRGASLTS